MTVYGQTEITADLMGTDVSVAGAVAFLDTSAPDGVWFELESGGCRVDTSG